MMISARAVSTTAQLAVDSMKKGATQWKVLFSTVLLSHRKERHDNVTVMTRGACDTGEKGREGKRANEQKTKNDKTTKRANRGLMAC